MTRTKSPDASPRLRLDFEAPDFRADPYPTFRRLRTEHPIGRDDRGFWVFSRYRDVEQLLRDRRWSSDTRNATAVTVSEEHPGLGGASLDFRPALFYDPPAFAAVRPFLFLDPPEHRRLRKAFSAAFTPRAVDKQRHRTAELLDAILRSHGTAPFDLVEQIAYPIPLTIICELLGIPPDDRDLFLECSGPLAALINPGFSRTARDRENSVRQLFTLSSYLWALVEERRKTPGDDLVSALLAAGEGDDVLTDQEVVSSCVLLLVAGHETTAGLIGTGLLALARRPSQAQLVRDEPALISGAVDELVRHEPAVQIVARTALEDFAVDTAQITAGDHAIGLIGAANHDDTVFTQPDHLDIRRSNAQRHLSFGFGIHHCLGAPLARMEVEEVVGGIVRRFRDIEVLEEPVYRGDVVLRGLASLVVRLRT